MNAKNPVFVISVELYICCYIIYMTLPLGYSNESSGGKACKTLPNFLEVFFTCKSTVAFLSTEFPEKQNNVYSLKHNAVRV